MGVQADCVAEKLFPAVCNSSMRQHSELLGLCFWDCEACDASISCRVCEAGRDFSKEPLKILLL